MVATSRAKLKPVTLVAQKVLGPAGFYLKLVLDSSLKTKGRGQLGAVLGPSLIRRVLSGKVVL